MDMSALLTPKQLVSIAKSLMTELDTIESSNDSKFSDIVKTDFGSHDYKRIKAEIISNNLKIKTIQEDLIVIRDTLKSQLALVNSLRTV
jgi:hypothetical protein